MINSAELLPPSFRANEDHWLFLYARTFCRGLDINGHRLKGRNHAPRREVNGADPFLCWLPYAMVHPPRPGTYDKLRHLKRKDRGEVFDNVRVVAEADYQRLCDALLAVGYDLERSRLIYPPAFHAANAYFHLQREPIPLAVAWPNLPAAKAALAKRDRQEDAHLFRNLQS